MRAVLDIFQGDSFTVAFAMPTDYDMTRLTSAKVYLGSTLYPHIIEGVGLNIIKATISSAATAALIYRQDLSLTIDDTELGVKKVDAGFVNVLPINSPYYTIAESNVYSVVVSVIVTDTALSTSAALYNVLRGKTAYESAVDGGYTGTEPQFYLDMANVQNIDPFLERAEAAADSAEADAAQTALDRIATAADRVQTGLDVIATAADLVQTNLDTIATAADRVATGADAAQTALDRIATAADVVLTDADAVATAADRVQTGLDRVATASDRVQTGLDRVATAADRVVTGQDKVAAAGSASTALQAETDAQTAQGLAETAQGLSETAQGLSEAARDKSEKWAEEAEDVEVEAGKFSAKHWAEKSADASAAFQAASPVTNYVARVGLDSGVIQSLESLTKTYIQALDLMSSALFIWDGRAGMKTRTVGANTYATKIYDMGAGNRDASQAAEANQPFISGVIAPNESRKLKAVSKTSARNIQFDSITKTNLETWSIFAMVKLFNNSTSCILSGENHMIYFNNRYLYIFNGISKEITNVYAFNEVNKLFSIGIVANGDGNISIYKDGGLYKSISGTTEITMNTMMSTGWFGNTYQFVGELPHLSIFDKALSASEITALDSYLATQHPEIETVTVGGYQIATSNYEGVVVSDGTVIPEVTDNATWATSTTLYDNAYAATSGTVEQKTIAALKAASMWSYNENLPATGAWAGKGLNEYAVRLLNRYAPTGTHIPTEAEWNAVIALLGTATVAGKKMKALSSVYWTTASGTNESGLSVIGAASRNEDGTFATILSGATIWTATNVDADNAKALVIADGADTATMTNTSKKIGASVRLFLNTPAGDQNRVIEATTVVNFASGTANVDVTIPWGYKVEGVTVNSTTGLTGLVCVLYTGAGAALETLFTAKAVTANVQKYLTADADQSVQKVDAFLRFNGVKADTGGSVQLSIRLEKAL